MTEATYHMLCIYTHTHILVKKNGELNKESVLVTHSCPTLCNPMDCSPPGSSVHGILQARILENGGLIK